MRRDLIVIPFHDWRKCMREGFRTRDAHLIEAFTRGGMFERVLVVSRPITRLELALRREARDPGWPVIARGTRWHVTRDSRGCYVYEHFSPGALGQILLGKSWFHQAYGSDSMTEGLFEALGTLGMERPLAMAMSIRSSGLAAWMAESQIPLVFDAWDNWLRIPVGCVERRLVHESYATFARIAPLWFTNSEINRAEFQRQFGIESCIVVPNGVDFDRFAGSPCVPEQMKRIPRPRVLFGGKITHLFDAGLFNEVARRLPLVHFVVAGQIIDRAVWRRVKKRPNVHYVGDIHYDEYPAFVSASDACIAPYVEDAKAHGGNSIKLYEYAAARRRTVSTAGNGARQLAGVVSLANTPEEFVKAILASIEGKGVTPELRDSSCSWDERSRVMAEHMTAPYAGNVEAVAQL